MAILMNKIRIKKYIKWKPFNLKDVVIHTKTMKIIQNNMNIIKQRGEIHKILFLYL